ncbi:hypothetical protein Pta02_26900 [Planobispora takensis]|uniref:PurM-like N-terminal domain-containing protein n=2 Tax=Planobispora takensis TaxID=1367882 RepID=A0A8J3WV92_9ACTN|nr:hypothetical protein Pta02_26900 [Planobispora takensis]
MGADPTAIVVGLGLPSDVGTGWLDDLTDGFRDECDLVGAGVAGGDTTRCDLVVISVTALGDLGGRAPVTRSGARPGDVVAVAGRLGHAAAGLALLESGHEGLPGPDGRRRDDPRRDDPRRDGRAEPYGSDERREDGVAGLVGAHRRPRPPYPCGPQAAALGATAMLDVSDGLLQDLGHVARASGVGIALDPGAFTVTPEMERVARLLAADPLDWVLTGGEDHALAATFPAEVRLPPAWTVVGRVTGGEGVQVSGRTVGQGGWDHFRM